MPLHSFCSVYAVHIYSTCSASRQNTNSFSPPYPCRLLVFAVREGVALCIICDSGPSLVDIGMTIDNYWSGVFDTLEGLTLSRDMAIRQRKSLINIPRIFYPTRIKLPRIFYPTRIKLPRIFYPTRIKLPRIFYPTRIKLPRIFYPTRIKLPRIFYPTRIKLPRIFYPTRIKLARMVILYI